MKTYDKILSFENDFYKELYEDGIKQRNQLNSKSTPTITIFCKIDKNRLNVCSIYSYQIINGKIFLSNIMYKKEELLCQIYLILNLFIRLNYAGEQEILQMIVNVNSANTKKSAADMKMKTMKISKRAGD